MYFLCNKCKVDYVLIVPFPILHVELLLCKIFQSIHAEENILMWKQTKSSIFCYHKDSMVLGHDKHSENVN